MFSPWEVSIGPGKTEFIDAPLISEEVTNLKRERKR
jgi:hypothetical protein